MTSILIISYNTREMTLACLASVVEQTTPGTFEVIVVDNASTDGSADAIAAAFPGVRLVRLDQNLGFAAGNNVAAGIATGRLLLLLNPDTVVLDRAIGRLVSFAESHDRAGIWGGRTVFADGSLNPASCWARPTLWSVFCIASGLTACFRGSALFQRNRGAGVGHMGFAVSHTLVARAALAVVLCYTMARAISDGANTYRKLAWVLP